MENQYFSCSHHWVDPSSVFIFWSTGFLDKIFPVDVDLTSLLAHMWQEVGPLRIPSTGPGSEGRDDFLKGQQRELRNKFSSCHVFLWLWMSTGNFSLPDYYLEQIKLRSEYSGIWQVSAPGISVSLCLLEPVMWSLSLRDTSTNVIHCATVDVCSAS